MLSGTAEEQKYETASSPVRHAAIPDGRAFVSWAEQAFGGTGVAIAGTGIPGSYRRIRIRRCGTRLITCSGPSDFGPRDWKA
jgi:hypothetical protein